MTIPHLSLVALALLGSLAVSAQNVRRIPLPANQKPANTDPPIAGAVWVGDTLYVSGWLDPDMKTDRDTQSQTAGLLKDVEKFLETQKLTLGDVVMMHVYLGADPGKGGKGDFAGMTAAFTQFFGTKEQPNRPARTTLEVALPAASRGALVEIDFTAARSK